MIKQVNKGMLLEYYCQYLGVECLKYGGCMCLGIKMKISKKCQVHSMIIKTESLVAFTSIPKMVFVVTT